MSGSSRVLPKPFETKRPRRSDRVSSRAALQRTRSIRAALFGVLAVVLLLAPAMAHASAFSSWSYRNSVGGTSNGCARAAIVDTTDHRAYAGRASSSACTSFVSSSPGYLGAQAWGYRSGMFCASTTFPVNGTTATTFAIGNNGLCSNPAGLQNFYTCAQTRFYSGSGYYTGPFGPCSPEQSY